MTKNKIEGVKPFNEFWFKSCYYHQLISGLSCLGISRDAGLLFGVETAEKDFSVKKYEHISQKMSEKNFGYRCKRCNITKKNLIKNIDAGRPVIIAVDCFYLESRPDSYRNMHIIHFILVYGYDLETGEADIVDHDYTNSYLFKEKKVSLDNLLESNKYYRKKGKSRYFTSRVLYKKGQKIKNRKFIFPNRETILLGQKSSEENLMELKRLFVADRKLLQEKTMQIIEYLREIKQQFLCVSCLENKEVSEKGRLTATELAHAYSYLIALLWKMFNQKNYEYAVKHLDSILRKIDYMLTCEKEVYGLLLRFCI